MTAILRTDWGLRNKNINQDTGPETVAAIQNDGSLDWEDDSRNTKK